MTILPVSAPAVTVAIDGREVRSYEPAVLIDDRVVAPVAPFVTQLADRVVIDGSWIIIERAGRVARVRVDTVDPRRYDVVYVSLAAALRPLGITVHYDPGTRRLTVTTHPAPLVTTPVPSASEPLEPQPHVVFTPTPQASPRPVYTGPPQPRRTPLPAIAPTPLSPYGSKASHGAAFGVRRE